MGYRSGAYIAPEATELSELRLVEGDLLFKPDLHHLQRSFPWVYYLLPKNTFNNEMGASQMYCPTSRVATINVKDWVEHINYPTSRTTNVNVKEGVSQNNFPTGWAPKLREEDDQQLGLNPPPHSSETLEGNPGRYWSHRNMGAGKLRVRRKPPSHTQ